MKTKVKRVHSVREFEQDPRVLAALRSAAPAPLLTRLRQAFDKPLWYGPWDEGSVHMHEPPFCFTRNPRHDCTLRVVEMLRAGLSYAHCQHISLLRRSNFREALLRHGVPLAAIGRASMRLTDEQIAVIRELWEQQWSAKEITSLIYAESGRVVQPAAVYSVTPAKFPEGTITYKLVLPLDVAQDIVDIGRALKLKPNKVVERFVRKGLDGWKRRADRVKKEVDEGASSA